MDLAENYKEDLLLWKIKRKEEKYCKRDQKLKAELVEKKRISREIKEKVWKEMDKIIY